MCLYRRVAGGPLFGLNSDCLCRRNRSSEVYPYCEESDAHFNWLVSFLPDVFACVSSMMVYLSETAIGINLNNYERRVTQTP